MVYSIPITNYNYDINTESFYQSPFSAEERKQLILACKRIFRRDFFNDPMIRLDGIIQDENSVTFSISNIGFYDYLVTNYAYFKREEFLAKSTKAEADLLQRIIDMIEDDNVPEDFNDLCCRNYLSNGVAVSALMHDEEGYLIVKRAPQVGIANNYFSVSSTGTCGLSDITKFDPFKTTCVREIKEELNMTIPIENVRITHLACGVNKLQPVVICDVKCSHLREHISAIDQYSDFTDENSLYTIASKDKIRELLDDEKSLLTEVARFHLENAIMSEDFLDEL